MGTSLLTPNAADPITGLTVPLLGWQLTAATALDAFTGCNFIHRLGYIATLVDDVDPTANPPIWRLTIDRPGDVPIVIADTDWLVCDSHHAWGIPQATVTADYTVTAYTLPS